MVRELYRNDEMPQCAENVERFKQCMLLKYSMDHIEAKVLFFYFLFFFFSTTWKLMTTKGVPEEGERRGRSSLLEGSRLSIP